VFPDGTFVFIDVLTGANTLAPSFIAVFNWFEELKGTRRN